MRPVKLSVALAAVAIAVALTLTGCSAPPPAESPQAAALDSALASASTSVGSASTFVIGLEQPMPGMPTNTDLEALQTTLNAARSESGAAQREAAQSALEQLNAEIVKVTQVRDATPEGSANQEQLRQLVITLEVGRDAVAEALK